MPYVVRLYTNEARTEYTDHEFASMDAAQDKIWGRGEDPTDNDSRPLRWYDPQGFDLFDPTGVAVDGNVSDRIGTVKS